MTLRTRYDDLVTATAGTWKAAPAAPTAPPRDDVWEYALRLALTFGHWVHRRNETFTFIDADTVRRRMSIDFSLPVGRGLTPGDSVLVPLLLLDKVTLRNFDVRDADGRPLSLLTTSQNAEVIVGGLTVLLSGLALPAQAVDAQVLRSIVAEQDVDAATAAMEEALDPAGSLQLIIANDPRPAYRETVAGLIRELAPGFVALAPMTYEPGARRIVKVSYDASLGRRKSGSWLRGGYALANRLLSSFGLVGRVEVFSELIVGLAASYHCEAVPPAETYVADAVLLVRRGDGTRDAARRDRHRFRPHLYAPGRSRGDTGRLRLVIHAHREGLLFPLWAAAVLVTAGLWLVQDRLGKVDSQTLAAVMLVPFALAAYYVRSQENSYVTVMLRGLRVVAALPVIGGVLVIGALALEYVRAGNPVPNAAMHGAWWISRVAAGATAVLTVALVSPAAGRFVRWLARHSAASLACAALIGVAAILLVIRYGFSVKLPILG